MEDQNDAIKYTEITFDYEDFEGKKITKTVKLKRPNIKQFDHALQDMKKNMRRALHLLIDENLAEGDRDWYNQEKEYYPGLSLSIGEKYLLRLGVSPGN